MNRRNEGVKRGKPISRKMTTNKGEKNFDRKKKGKIGSRLGCGVNPG